MPTTVGSTTEQGRRRAVFTNQWKPFKWHPEALRLLADDDLQELRINGFMQQAEVAEECDRRLTPQSPETIYKTCSQQVFSIVASGARTKSGTGFAFLGRVITNFHVIAGASQIRVTNLGGETFMVAGIESADREHDLVALRLEKALPDVGLLSPARGSHTVAIGQQIIVIGDPKGLRSTLSSGLISGIRDSGNLGRLYQITAPVSPGSSGSPVLNTFGEVIGVVTSSRVDGQNLNFCTPIDYIDGPTIHDPMPIERWAEFSRDPVADAFPPVDRDIAQAVYDANHVGAWALRGTRTLHIRLSSLTEQTEALVPQTSLWHALADPLRAGCRGISMPGDTEPDQPPKPRSYDDPTAILEVTTLPTSTGFTAMIVLSVERPAIPSATFGGEGIPKLIDRSAYPAAVWQRRQLVTGSTGAHITDTVTKLARALVTELMLANPEPR